MREERKDEIPTIANGHERALVASVALRHYSATTQESPRAQEGRSCESSMSAAPMRMGLVA